MDSKSASFDHNGCFCCANSRYRLRYRIPPSHTETAHSPNQVYLWPSVNECSSSDMPADLADGLISVLSSGVRWKVNDPRKRRLNAGTHMAFGGVRELTRASSPMTLTISFWHQRVPVMNQCVLFPGLHEPSSALDVCDRKLGVFRKMVDVWITWEDEDWEPGLESKSIHLRDLHGQ